MVSRVGVHLHHQRLSPFQLKWVPISFYLQCLIVPPRVVKFLKLQD